VNDQPLRPLQWARALSRRAQVCILIIFVLVVGAVVWVAKSQTHNSRGDSDTALSSQSRRVGFFHPTPAQWATLTVEPVQQRIFRAEHTTEGKVAVDEDRSTPIFSPYAGRVTKLLAKPGDIVARGQPLFTVEATDMVQAQNDFIAAATGLNKARSALNLAQIIDTRQRLLYEGKAVPLKEVQNARAALDAAENDVRSGEVALEATRNRLRILGKTDQEIAEFQEKGTIDPSTPIYAPIAGTIVQRKVGPGQYIGTGTSDPVFIIGDLSTVWLVAYIRETEALAVQIGQALNFTVLAYPERSFPANISYVATSLDPTTRRLMVRATVNTAARLLKPEMFASVNILTGEGDTALAVPRQAVIYEGDAARIWIVRSDNAIELKRIKVGLTSGSMIQVVDGLKPGDRVITKGSLFIDRAATGA
jgi:cobalt-zinc-cadmium efflux system membrane fusion protein